MAAAAVLLALGCSGGGSGGTASPANLAGQWKVWIDVTGEEIGPFPVCLTQNGVTLDGANLTGSVNGNSFTVTSPDFLGIGLNMSGTTSGTTAQGSLALTGTPIVGTFRMETFAPDGNMTVSGRVESQPIDINGINAVGVREYSDQAHTMLQEVEVSYGDGSIFFELSFGANIALGDNSIGNGVSLQIGVVTDAAQHDVSATSGTVTVTSYDSVGIAGTFSATMPGGQTVSGTFDVNWDFDAYEP